MASQISSDRTARGEHAMIWEICQTLFMLGTLLTVLVNVRSIVWLTRRIEYLEDQWERRHEL